MALPTLLRKRKKKESVIRYAFNLLHLWLGLLSGLVLVIVCLTGSILVFEQPIENYINRKIRYVSEGGQRLPLDRLVANYNDRFSLPPGRITVSEDPKIATHFFAFNRKSGERVSAYLDPYTGKVLGVENSSLQSFFSSTLRLHRWLLVRGVGKQIVGASTLVFLFMLLSGLVLWWPRKRKQLKAALTIKRKAKFFRLNYDLHNVLGFYALIGLFILGVSGLYFSYGWVRNGIVLGLGGEIAQGQEQHQHVDNHSQSQKNNLVSKDSQRRTDNAETTTLDTTKMKQRRGRKNTDERGSINNTPAQGEKDGNSPSSRPKRNQKKEVGKNRSNGHKKWGIPPKKQSFALQTGLEKIHNTFRYNSEVRINMPGPRSKNYVFTKYDTDNLFGASLPDIMEFGPNGKPVKAQTFTERPIHEKIRALILPIHSGDLMGWPSMIVAFLLCLVGTSLPVTGFLIWLKRKNANGSKSS